MASDAGMDEFVKDDVIGQVRRHDGQERVELDAAGGRGAAPDGPLAADTQAAGAIAVLAGQSVQALGEIRPGGAAVQTLSGLDRLTAAAAGALNMGERAPDPANLGEGDSSRFLERHAPGDSNPDPPGGPYGQRDAAGPPGLFEQNGADTVEAERPRSSWRRAGLTAFKHGIGARPHDAMILPAKDRSQGLSIRRARSQLSSALGTEQILSLFARLIRRTLGGPDGLRTSGLLQEFLEAGPIGLEGCSARVGQTDEG